MKDKEVGELWRWWLANDDCNDEVCSMNSKAHQDIEDLILKLVEERATQYSWETAIEKRSGIPEALKDFGIDPESYKVVKE